MPNPSIFNTADFVRVTNDGADVLQGRYAGEDYEFPIGEPVNISVAAAHHIFGFGGDERARMNAFMRHGWIKTSDDVKDAKRRLTKIKFEEVSNVTELVTRTKTRHVGPLGAGGAEGAGTEATPQLPAPEDPLAIDELDTPDLSGERI